MKHALLTPCKTYMHLVCGFAFHITFTGKDGVDQHGGKWLNVAENDNSVIPQPVNPKYLDAYLDAFNNIKNYFE